MTTWWMDDYNSFRDVMQYRKNPYKRQKVGEDPEEVETKNVGKFDTVILCGIFKELREYLFL